MRAADLLQMSMLKSVILAELQGIVARRVLHVALLADLAVLFSES